jgi:DnaJ-class molecular chaperone
MSDTPKKTIDEQILERLQALEVVVMEQRKEIDSLTKKIGWHEFESHSVSVQKKQNCPKCGGSGFPEFVNESACTVCKGSGVI